MKPFDIFSWHPAGWPEPHPAVIISHPDRVLNKPEVEVLMCSSKKATRNAMSGEVILDQADGLDWPTLCKCDLIHVVKKADLTSRRGEVTSERRSHLVRGIIAAHGWGQLLTL